MLEADPCRRMLSITTHSLSCAGVHGDIRGGAGGSEAARRQHGTRQSARGGAGGDERGARQRGAHRRRQHGPKFRGQVPRRDLARLFWIDCLLVCVLIGVLGCAAAAVCYGARRDFCSLVFALDTPPLPVWAGKWACALSWRRRTRTSPASLPRPCRAAPP